MKVIYVSGPYTHGSVEENVEKAIDVAAVIIKAGGAPIIPHLSYHIDKKHSIPYRKWIELDLAIVAKCDAVFRIGGHSPGADKETACALLKRIPVFHSLEKLAEWL